MSSLAGLNLDWVCSERARTNQTERGTSSMNTRQADYKAGRIAYCQWCVETNDWNNHSSHALLDEMDAERRNDRHNVNIENVGYCLTCFSWDGTNGICGTDPKPCKDIETCMEVGECICYRAYGVRVCFVCGGEGEHDWEIHSGELRASQNETSAYYDWAERD